LFTHPGAGVAFKVGDASIVASVVAGVVWVTVMPNFKFVGSTDIAGTDGCVYVPPVDESPEPPARLPTGETPEWMRHSTIAATTATIATIRATVLLRAAST
jgi:hypothetical protein